MTDKPEPEQELDLPSPENSESLQKALKEAQEKAEEYWERLLRKEADLQNMQKRMQQDIDNTRKIALERFAGELLEVLDSLDQGISFSESNNASVKDLLEGMKLTHTVLLNVLDKEGIKIVEPKVGDVFDPNFHEALAMQETKEYEPNRIVTVVQKGYMLHHRLLRPARVVVSKAS